jgi:hypothetical protein
MSQTVVDNDQRQRVRDGILRHLGIHPDASDTPEGIRDWWLPPADANVAPALLVEVLDDLVVAGIMRRRRLPDGGILYAAARAPRLRS